MLTRPGKFPEQTTDCTEATPEGTGSQGFVPQAVVVLPTSVTETGASRTYLHLSRHCQAGGGRLTSNKAQVVALPGQRDDERACSSPSFCVSVFKHVSKTSVCLGCFQLPERKVLLKLSHNEDIDEVTWPDEAPGCWGQRRHRRPTRLLPPPFSVAPAPPAPQSPLRGGLGKEGVGRQCHADSLQGIYYFFI